MGQKILSLTERETEVILSALLVVRRTSKGPNEINELYEKVRQQTGGYPDAGTVKLMVSNVAADFDALRDHGEGV